MVYNRIQYDADLNTFREDNASIGIGWRLVGVDATSKAINMTDIPRSLIELEVNGAATTSDLETINGGFLGQLLRIRAASGNTITVKDGADNIVLDGGDITLSGSTQIEVLFDGANWVSVQANGPSSGGGGGSQLAVWGEFDNHVADDVWEDIPMDTPNFIDTSLVTDDTSSNNRILLDVTATWLMRVSFIIEHSDTTDLFLNFRWVIDGSSNVFSNQPIGVEARTINGYKSDTSVGSSWLIPSGSANVKLEGKSNGTGSANKARFTLGRYEIWKVD